jgi:hypothetical protein
VAFLACGSKKWRKGAKSGGRAAYWPQDDVDQLYCFRVQEDTQKARQKPLVCVFRLGFFAQFGFRAESYDKEAL